MRRGAKSHLARHHTVKVFTQASAETTPKTTLQGDSARGALAYDGSARRWSHRGEIGYRNFDSSQYIDRARWCFVHCVVPDNRAVVGDAEGMTDSDVTANRLPLPALVSRPLVRLLELAAVLSKLDTDHKCAQLMTMLTLVSARERQHNRGDIATSSRNREHIWGYMSPTTTYMRHLQVY